LQNGFAKWACKEHSICYIANCCFVIAKFFSLLWEEYKMKRIWSSSGNHGMARKKEQV
jgi:hypothetical protein